MATANKKKLKVVFAPNPEPVEDIVTDAFITQLMTTITRVGLRADQLNSNYDKIKKETENEIKKN